MVPPKIDFYRFGEIVIDGERHSRDVIVYPDRVQANWWREEGHSLSPADLDEVMREPPEVLVIGQGAYGRMDVPADTQRWLEAAGVQVVAEKTERACETYNRLREEAAVVAALHLTC